jgi:hypothetical protein
LITHSKNIHETFTVITHSKNIHETFTVITHSKNIHETFTFLPPLYVFIQSLIMGLSGKNN